MKKTALVILQALLLILAGCIETPREEIIKIGVIAPLSGGPALWGQGSLNMINLAVEEINWQGGVNGKKLTIIPEDGKCQPQSAVTAAQKLIRVDNIKFILGGHCSPETVAIVPIIDEARVFLLAGVTSSDEAVSGSKYAFRTSPATIEQARIISNRAYDKYGYKKIALITEEAAYSKSFSEDIKNTFPGTVLEELNYPPEETDFRSGLLKIKEKKPDAIWISPQDPNEAVLVLKQMKELGMLNTPLFGNTILVSTEVYEQSGGLLPETAFTVTLFADPNTAKSLELQQKYKEKYGEDIPYNLYYISAAYDATYLLKNALELCGEDADCVQRYFENLEGYEGAAGNFTFKDNGDPVFDSWKEMRIENGKAVLS
jgi:branched-chain amino acid transport system substrate-binding protein